PLRLGRYRTGRRQLRSGEDGLMTVRELIQLLRTLPVEVDLHIRPRVGPIGEQKLTSASKYIVLRNGKIILSAECYNEPYPFRWFMQEYGSVLQPGDEVYTKVK